MLCQHEGRHCLLPASFLLVEAKQIEKALSSICAANGCIAAATGAPISRGSVLEVAHEVLDYICQR